MSDNIVQFPKKPRDTDTLPTTHEEAFGVLNEVRSEYVKEVTEVILDNLASDINRYGFRFSDARTHQKDWFFLGEAVEAVLSRYAKLDHHLHEAIDDAIRFPDEAAPPIPAEPKKKRTRKKKPTEEITSKE